ncbi:MAG: 50S ribosomal protein L9 [Balneolaceae bacterium]
MNNAAMKVILKEDIEKLGNAGEVVDVKPGYGRNFLIPRSKAVLATAGALKDIERMRREAKLRAELTVEAAKELAEKIEATSITISVTAGEDDKIHGTVTTIQIAEALQEKEIVVDRRKISLDQDVKSLGEYTATVELISELKPKVKIWVVKED